MLYFLIEREVIKMTYEEALKELEKLMKENQDVLIRLKNGLTNDDFYATLNLSKEKEKTQ